MALTQIVGDLAIYALYNNNEWSAKYYEKIKELLVVSADLTEMSHSELDKFIFDKIGFGVVAEYIYEYIQTGKIADLQSINTIKNLMKVYGIGPATCKKLIEKGIYTVDDLRKSTYKLNHAQQCGLKYYDDLNTRIPRDDITYIGLHIKTLFGNVDNFDIAGSYRRGAPTSGDIDIIVSTDTLAGFRERIEKDPIFVDFLSAGQSRLTFLCKTNGLVKQVDILLIPQTSYAAALLYFTGSADFNIAMRYFAKTKGYKLNQVGLYKNKDLVLTKTEKDIFDKLGLQYISPENRLGANNINVKH